MKDIKKQSIRELQSNIRTLGKTANQRLRQLEGKTRTNKTDLSQASHGYQYLKQLEFDGKPFIGKTGKGEIKFITAVGRGNNSPFTVNQLREELTTIKNFLESKTSTVTGVKNVSLKAYEKAKKQGFIGSETEYKDFAIEWKDTLMQNFKDMYGSTELNDLRLENQELNFTTFKKLVRKAGFTKTRSTKKYKKPSLKKIKKTFKQFKNKGV